MLLPACDLTPLHTPAQSQENLAPNVLAQENLLEAAAPPAREKRPVRKAKKVARVPTQVAAQAAAVVEAAPAERRSASPRANKQQKLGDGGVALLQRTGVPVGGSWQVSPPLSKVQERHTAFAVRVEATLNRGASALAVSAQQYESEKREVDGLAQCVAQVCALDH